MCGVLSPLSLYSIMAYLKETDSDTVARWWRLGPEPNPDLSYSIQFNSCLFTCKLNSTEANYKVSTVTWIYTKITEEQDTKHDSLHNGNKLIIVPRKKEI
jgi:hypothetical protein